MYIAQESRAVSAADVISIVCNGAKVSLHRACATTRGQVHWVVTAYGAVNRCRGVWGMR